MKNKFVELYMDMAQRVAAMSYAERMQVGAVLVKDDVVVYGYNGTPAGWENVCETRDYMPNDTGGWLDTEFIYERWPLVDDQGDRYKLVTKPEVLHAEMNALAKMSRSTISSCGASLFVTCAPCIDCAKAIYQAGVVQVYYLDAYRTRAGIEFLTKCGIAVEQILKPKLIN